MLKKLALLLPTCMLLAAVAFAAGGSASDPLVSLSYLLDPFTKSVEEEVERRLDASDKVILEGIADGGDIMGHAGEDIAHRRPVHEFHRQPLDLIRKLDADIAGKIAADRLIEQPHLGIEQYRADQIHRGQQAQPRQHRLHHFRRHARRGVVIHVDRSVHLD